MPLPYLMINGHKIAPFKFPTTQPYGAFANTTAWNAFPTKIRAIIPSGDFIIDFPSSEHAYHAQKIIYCMSKFTPDHPIQNILINMLNEIINTQSEYSPRSHYTPLVENNLAQLNQFLNPPLRNKIDFDALCDSDYHCKHKPQGGRATYHFMRTAVWAKLTQHPELAELAMACAQEGVFPVEVSQYDDNWAAGKDGDGENMLGIIILDLGNHLLRNSRGVEPSIPDPFSHYLQLKQQLGRALSHDALAPDLIPNANWTMQAERKYLQFNNGNKRLVLDEDYRIVGYEFRNPPNNWQPSGAPERFGDLTQFHSQCANYFTAIVALHEKINSLRIRAQNAPGNPAITQALEAAEHLENQLKAQEQHFFSNIDRNTYDQFKTDCNALINTAHESLDKHRGWGQILGNIGLAVAGLGVFYAIALMINKAVNGHFFFFETDSSQKIDAISESLEEFVPRQ